MSDIALGTGCITPVNYIVYNQVEEADKKIKKSIIRNSLVAINAVIKANRTQL